MGFLDQIGKKVSDAGKGVAQQTKVLAETTKIGSMISDEEKKITQLYTNIGQSYYSAHYADQEGDFLEEMAAITASLENIYQWREQIKEYKGVTKCPNCGADVPNNAQFCNNCGSKMPSAENQMNIDKMIQERMVQKKRVCPSCGDVVPPENKFCMKCGTKVDEE